MKQITPENRILCFDSGIGGLSYLQQLRSQNLAQFGQWLYLADNAYFPFGEKDQENLRERIFQVIYTALEVFPAKVVVLLCNTATILALDELRRRLPQQLFIGTVPAIKPAALASHRRRIAVLASRSTSQAAYLGTLHRQFAANCDLHAIDAGSLIRFIEEQWADCLQLQQASRLQKAEKEAIAPFVKLVIETGADQVVLGCTHFLHLRKGLEAAFQAADPNITLCDSVQGIANRLQMLQEETAGATGETFLSEETGTLPTQQAAETDRLLLTRSQDLQRWESWAERFALQIDEHWLPNGNLADSEPFNPPANC